ISRGAFSKTSCEQAQHGAHARASSERDNWSGGQRKLTERRELLDREQHSIMCTRSTAQKQRSRAFAVIVGMKANGEFENIGAHNGLKRLASDGIGARRLGSEQLTTYRWGSEEF